MSRIWTVWKRTFLPLTLVLAFGATLATTALGNVAPKYRRSLRKVSSDQKNEFAKRSHDVGRFKLPISNYGVHGQHETAVGSGGEWPNGSRDYYIFGAGIWIAGKVPGDPEGRVAVGYNPNSAAFEMYPGTLPNNDGEVGPMEILYMSTDGEDYANWPLRNPDGTPKIVSVQDSWATYNDMNPAWTFSTEKPLGVQVIQRGYAWNYTTNQDIVFLEFNIINITNDPLYPDAAAKFDPSTPAPPPNTTLVDMYIGPGVDPDIGRATDDMLDFDPSRNLGIAWDFDGKEANFDLDLDGDGEIGDTGVLGYDFLESPIADRDVDVNGDGVVNDDSVNFGTEDKPIWVKDVHKGEQLGLTAFKIFVLQIDPRTDQERYDLMAGYDYRTMIPGGDSVYVPFDVDTAPEDKRFIQCTGPFNLAPGDTARTVVAIMVGANMDDLKRLSDVAQAIYDNGYFLPRPPIAPNLKAIEGDRMVTLIWDDSPETAEDPFAEVALDPNSVFYDPNYVAQDFQGYRVYRSLTGVPGSWTMLAQYDKKDGVTARIDTVIEQGLKIPVRIELGTDTGLQHHYVDTDVKNGVAYYYSVTSYDYQPVSTPVTLESATVNALVAVPRAEQAGYRSPQVEVERCGGISDGGVEVKIIDPVAVTGHDYQITFTDSMLEPIDPLKLGSKKFWHVKDVQTGEYVIKNRNYFNSWGIGGDEALPVDGLIYKILDVEKQITSLTKVFGKDAGKTLGILPYYGGRNVKANKDYRDFEFRYTGFTNEAGDTVNYGIQIQSLGLTNPVKKPCPYELWDIGVFTDEDGDGRDDNPDDDVRLWPLFTKIGNFHFILDSNSPGTHYDEDFFSVAAHDPNNTEYWRLNMRDPKSRYDWDYQIAGMPVSPEDTSWAVGDVWRVVNTVPIVPGPDGDCFLVKTQQIQVVKAADELKAIKVVPNPFIIADDFMRDPAFPEVHFTHLPAKCTIRIFNTAGDLIQTLHHDQPGIDSDGYEPWNLLSKNDQLVASGVYIFHVEAPGYGEFVGKFAVIVR
ncbi:MAG: hypothetical protein GXO73_12880 [Calditrichaeota bacterium]|nr:hypothetical protein [Calditrichota bacterium]